MAEGLNTIILSGENLINPEGFQRLFAGLDRQFDIQFILYIRRQDDYLASAWLQLDLKQGETVERFLERAAGQPIANWHDQLLPWEEAVGRERIILRRYGRHYLKDGDIVADFNSVTGIEVDGCEPLAMRINPSYSDALGRMASRVADVFEGFHDNRFYEALAYAIGDKAYQQGGMSTMFNYRQRMSIFDAYASGNEALKRKYFADLAPDEPLFEPPDPSQVVALTHDEQMAEEHELLIRAVYRMAEKVRTLEARGGGGLPGDSTLSAPSEASADR